MELCPICQVEAETITHTFLKCNWTRPIWFGGKIQLVPGIQSHLSFGNWFAETLEILETQGDFFQYALTNLGFTLWEIWKAMNLFVFQGVGLNPSVIRNRIMVNHHEFTSATSTQEQSTQEAGGNTHRKGWRKPSPTHLKINTDAAFSAATKKGAAGIIIRDSQGNMIHGFTAHFQATSPLMAEALALSEAVFLAANLGCEQAIFESNCLSAIQACRGEKKIWEI